MASAIESHSPLELLSDELAATSGAATIKELLHIGKINLRGNPSSDVFSSAISSALCCNLPIVPNTFTQAGGLSVLWLGPDEWLIVLGPEHLNDSRTLEARLRRTLAGQGTSIVDVSDSRTVIELVGPKARNVLMKGCSLDLHPRAFKPGQCAQTLLARAPIILQQLAHTPEYRIFVANSFAHYTAKWLCDAAHEYDI
jgi:sarcosine oxidase subunit gamma